ncbi:MAG TPA: HNH endonuclease signature motif containing protein [Burkholderiaceae bacterium]|nr:HNH endonuclease signature motif containing protein [Burkholderiaceae bacterium]
MALKLHSDLERFSLKCEYVEATGCWQWTGSLDKDGYARRSKVGSRTDGTRREVSPHRWFYEEFVGPIPAGLVTDHLCRNRACVNPWHIEPVTALVNHKRGERALATVCSKGHLILGANEVKRRGGHRCRICHNAYLAAYHRSTGHRHSRAYRERKRSEKSAPATF